jgi:hypothetical protein
MKRTTAALMLGLSHVPLAMGQSRVDQVLPHRKLLRCGSSDRSQMWPDAAEPKAAFPKQVIVDIDEACMYGMTAM